MYIIMQDQGGYSVYQENQPMPIFHAADYDGAARHVHYLNGGFPRAWVTEILERLEKMHDMRVKGWTYND
jgi:hypothetical protein